MRRYLETFCLHPWLYLAPAMLVLLAGVAGAFLAKRSALPYLAGATVAVNLDPTRTRPLGERPPAEHHAELLGELVETDSFLLTALGRIGISPGEGDVRAELARLRANWRQEALGPNTLYVAYRCAEAAPCETTVAAVLELYHEETSRARLISRQAAVAFYEEQVATTERTLRALPETDRAYSATRQAYEVMLVRLADARLEEQREREALQAEFRMLMTPRAWEAGGTLRAIAVPLFLGGVLAVVIAAGQIAVTTWLTTTIRSSGDVMDLLGLRTVAVISSEATRQTERKTATTVVAAPAIGPVRLIQLTWRALRQRLRHSDAAGA